MKTCEYCGSKIPHVGKCPNVKAFEYYPDGTIKRVEFTTPSDYLAPLSPMTPVYPTNPWYPQPQPWSPLGPILTSNTVSCSYGLLNENDNQS